MIRQPSGLLSMIWYFYKILQPHFCFRVLFRGAWVSRCNDLVPLKIMLIVPLGKAKKNHTLRVQGSRFRVRDFHTCRTPDPETQMCTPHTLYVPAPGLRYGDRKAGMIRTLRVLMWLLFKTIGTPQNRNQQTPPFIAAYILM